MTFFILYRVIFSYLFHFIFIYFIRDYCYREYLAFPYANEVKWYMGCSWGWSWWHLLIRMFLSSTASCGVASPADNSTLSIIDKDVTVISMISLFLPFLQFLLFLLYKGTFLASLLISSLNWFIPFHAKIDSNWI